VSELPEVTHEYGGDTGETHTPGVMVQAQLATATGGVPPPPEQEDEE
jgi:hypothetical protein